MFELRVAVRTDDEQISRMVADGWFQMVNLKIGLPIPFLESKGTQLAFSLVQFPKQDPDGRRNGLMSVA